MHSILRVENVSKEYRLGVYGGGTLKADLQSAIAKLRHKEDPNLKIGQQAHISGDKLRALQEVSFSVDKGERVGIIGRNGAGKSTILKLISGVTAPTKGTIYLNGRITSMLEVGTGFHKELTGRENVYLNGAILGMTKHEIDQCFDQIVEFSEVGDFIDTQVKRYSSGMFVKLAFSVAAHLRSEIMIMDEVLAVGDVNFQNKCIEKMNEVSKEEGRTILYVSHNMNTIRQLCSRCVVLNKGRVIFDGDVEKGIDQYMGALQVSYQTEFDTENTIRPSDILLGTRINKISLINKTINVYETRESINVEFLYNSQADHPNARLMLIVFSKEGTRLGMTESSEFHLRKGEHRVQFTFEPMVLPDGDYYVELNIVERNAMGGYEKYDQVDEAFSFHIENIENLVTGKQWNQSIWGNAYYNPLVVKNV